MQDFYRRDITYLRLSITDRCNLRCTYCMPEQGVTSLSHDAVLRFEELEFLLNIFQRLGVRKLRFTGGEPLVRKDFVDFWAKVNGLFETTHLTTNGVLLNKYLPVLEKIGVSSINLSLDTLRKERFLQITRRDYFDQVYDSLFQLIHSSIPAKLNCVVQKGINDDEILDFVFLARDYDIEVRFIEEMPFNGMGITNSIVQSTAILALIQKYFPDSSEIPTQPDKTHSTGSCLTGSCPTFFSSARVFQVPGFRGRVGIIPSYSRSFCQGCNRVRLTALGHLKRCLYDPHTLDLRALLRADTTITEAAIVAAIQSYIAGKKLNGIEAEQNNSRLGDYVSKDSMSVIGG